MKYFWINFMAFTALLMNLNNYAFCEEERRDCPDVDQSFLKSINTEIESLKNQGYEPPTDLIKVKRYLSTKRTIVRIHGHGQETNGVINFSVECNANYMPLKNACIEDVLSKMCPSGYLIDAHKVECKGYRGD